jgi:hypothetical protein
VLTPTYSHMLPVRATLRLVAVVATFRHHGNAFSLLAFTVHK